MNKMNRVLKEGMFVLIIKKFYNQNNYYQEKFFALFKEKQEKSQELGLPNFDVLTLTS